MNPYNITKSFVVNVLNINEAPTGINITFNTVAENQDPGAFIGTISAVDPDNKVKIRSVKIFYKLDLMWKCP